MSDHLSLAHAIEDAGIPRGKAESVATAIARFVEGSVATRADLDRVETAVKAAITTVKADIATLDGDIARIDNGFERLRSTVARIENRLLVRIGGWMIALFGLLFAALHMWPPR